MREAESRPVADEAQAAIDVPALFSPTVEELRPAAEVPPVEARAARVELRAAASQSQVASSDIQSVTGPEAVPAGPTGGPSTGDQGEGPSEPEETVPARPALMTWRPGEVSDPPRLDAYAVRLVTTRKLYDGGTLVQHAPSLAALASGGEGRQ